MSQEDNDFEWVAEQLVSADSPAVIVSDSIDDHGTPESVGNIVECVSADVLATRDTWNLLSVSSASVTHVGPPRKNRPIAAEADVLLAVGYQLSDEFVAEVPVDEAGYSITPFAGEYTLEEYCTWREENYCTWRGEPRPDGVYPSPGWISLGDFEETIEGIADAVERVGATYSDDEAEEVTIYSSSNDEYPDPPEYDDLDPGESWRVATARKCPVCHTMTNKWILGGYPSRGSRQYCPANREKFTPPDYEPDERHEKHEELAELISRREELEQRLTQYDTDSEASERTINRLHDELEVIDEQIRTLREWFGGRFDDVKGIDVDREAVPAFNQ